MKVLQLRNHQFETFFNLFKSVVRVSNRVFLSALSRSVRGDGSVDFCSAFLIDLSLAFCYFLFGSTDSINIYWLFNFSHTLHLHSDKCFFL